MNGLKERSEQTTRLKSGIIVMNRKPWLPDQEHTQTLFRNLAIRRGSWLIQLPDEDANAQASAALITDAGDEIYEAIVSGRKTWVPRPDERQAIFEGLVRTFGHRLGINSLRTAVDTDIHRFFCRFSEDISEASPY